MEKLDTGEMTGRAPQLLCPKLCHRCSAILILIALRYRYGIEQASAVQGFDSGR